MGLPMLSNKFKELEQYRKKVSKLEQTILAERESRLHSLHAELGYASREELIKALRGAGKGGKRRGRKPGKAARAVGGRTTPRSPDR